MRTSGPFIIYYSSTIENPRLRLSSNFFKSAGDKSTRSSSLVIVPLFISQHSRSALSTWLPINLILILTPGLGVVFFLWKQPPSQPVSLWSLKIFASIESVVGWFFVSCVYSNHTLRSVSVSYHLRTGIRISCVLMMSTIITIYFSFCHSNLHRQHICRTSLLSSVSVPGQGIYRSYQRQHSHYNTCPQ